MKKITSLLLLIVCFNFYGQTTHDKFNLNFEKTKKGESLPVDWFQWGTYQLDKDSTTVYSGKYASKIVSDSTSTDSSFGSIAYKIPSKYKGSTIRLEGYMKIKEVKGGHAGLLMRLDGDSDYLQFNNMRDQGITGTIDWKKYTITFPFPEETENILVAGILVGQGTAWFDEFRVFIDDKNIQTLKEVKKIVAKAKMDKEFDGGSNFQLNQPNLQQIENLFKLGKIWGFVKYHHPEIAKGNINWDNELFRTVSAIDSDDFENIILKWLKSFEKPFEKSLGNNEIKGLEKNIAFESNVSWISSPDIKSEELRQLLVQLKKASKKSSNYYLKFAPNVGNPQFINEVSYKNMAWDDDGYKLLGLFRYWNMIEYFFPYKHLMDENWNEVLKKSIPEFLEADDELSYKLSTLKLIGKIQDTHGNINQQDAVLTEFLGQNIAPIEINFIEDKAVVVKIFEQLSNNTAIKVGDIVSKVNGVDVSDLVKEKIKYTTGSNHPIQLRAVSRRLLRTNETTIHLSLEGNEKKYEENISCVPLRNVNFWKKDIPSHKEINKQIGYIYPGTLKRGEIHDIMDKFINKKGLIVDLRCYPSDFIVFSLGKYLMPKPTEFVKFTHGSLEKPGQFSFSDPLKVGEENPNYFKGKVVILINDATVSQSEYTTMALRVAPKAMVIGSATAAADGNVSPIILPGNIRTMISGIGVYYPDGTETQRVGIIPDIEVKPTIKGIKEGRDEVLEKAIEIINKE